jgi:hypothetical protein
MFMERRCIGPWCREDDALRVRYMEEAEQRFQSSRGEPLVLLLLWGR